jgi:hypothetical protein
MNVDGACMDKPDPIHFFMAMNWLGTYKTEEQLAGNFKVTKKIAQKWIWKYTGAIQALKVVKVSSTTINNYTYKTISNRFSFATRLFGPLTTKTRVTDFSSFPWTTHSPWYC